MMKIFNNNYELAIRALIVLYAYESPLSIEGISAFDLLTTYGKQFKVYDYNLHGDNPLSFCEISTRRIEIKNSIKYLVINNLVNVIKTNQGFAYRINDKGSNVCKNIESEYAVEYLKIMNYLVDALNSKTEQDIINDVISFSVKGEEIDNGKN